MEAFTAPDLSGTLSICSGTRSTLNMPRATDMMGTPGTCGNNGRKPDLLLHLDLLKLECLSRSTF